jgi:hypothetical protein
MDNQEAQLPEGWTKNWSNSQKRPFWFHLATKTSQWHAPTETEANDPIAAFAATEEKAKLDPNLLQKKRRVDKDEEPSNDSRKKRAKSEAPPQKQTSVAIIVPFRDLHEAQNRAAHLSQFAPHMVSFLSKQLGVQISNYKIFIIEQSNDERKFNRGKLLNIGFDLARKDPTNPKFDVFVFHDVDLLPGKELIDYYAAFPLKPMHIARCWDRYALNPKYFGGIVAFSEQDMVRINGYPNTFWGWGGEDDEMQKRLEKCGIEWEFPPAGAGKITDLEEMTLQEKLSFLKENKSWKCMVKWEVLEEHDLTWKTNGLKNLTYKVLGTTSDLHKSGKVVKVLVDVELNGDHWSNAKCGIGFSG